MVLTEQGKVIAANVREALALIEDATSGKTTFQPEVSTRQFTIVASESTAARFMSRLVHIIEREAPHASIVLRSAAGAKLGEWFDTGEIDLMVGYSHAPTEKLFRTVLGSQELCVIARRGHPAIDGHISLAQYLDHRHVYFGSDITGTLEHLVDACLKRMRHSRKIACTVPNLSLTPDIVSQTDFIATVPARIVRESPLRDRLQMLGLPLPIGQINVSMVWHRRSHHDSAHRWLRAKVKAIFQAAP
jgi:DNA-binding transcriptional LysR family regulator